MKVCPECKGGNLGNPRACAECSADISAVVVRKGADLAGMVLEHKYRLDESIGEGAMGWVYRGTHLTLESTVAIKLMKPADDDDSITDQRFAQEARSASQLNNPHIISIIDFGRTRGGLLFIVSEYLRGETLTDVLKREGSLAPTRALRITDQILTGLEEAHAQALVHRDLKPDNIMITTLRSGEDFVKILDFGIAKIHGGKAKRLTQQGQVIGTPTYMAPEQIRGKEVSSKTDIYALGVMIYEMLTGDPPFDSPSVMEVLGMHLSAQPKPLSNTKDVPSELEAVILRAMSKDPDDRFKSAADLRETLGLIAQSLLNLHEQCPTCGNNFTRPAKFCEHCGTRLRGDTGGTPTVAKPATQIDDRRATDQTAAAPFPPDAAEDDPLGDWYASDQETRPVELPAPTHSRDTLNRRLRVEQTLKFTLTGRDEELSALKQFFDGDAWAAQILGPLGSGRTRLLREAAELAERRGLTVLKARPDPSLARRPWYPVQRLVARVLELPDAPSLADLERAVTTHGLAGEDVRGLAELFGIDSGDYLEHAVRLRETRAAALRALASDNSHPGGAVILVDDADELDGASRTLFTELLHPFSTTPMRVILVAEQALLPHGADVVTIEPRPLDRHMLNALMDATVPTRTASWQGLSQTMLDRSGGNVFHLTQAVRLLAEGGSEVDASVSDVVRTRVGRLPAICLRVLQTLCVVGHEASIEQIKELLGEERPDFDGALQLLIRRGLVSQPTSELLRVAHPTLATVVATAMPADARERLHTAVLEHLAVAGGSALTLARHAVGAGQGERALQLLHQAGCTAESLLDDATAAVQFQRALEVARWELLLDERHDTVLDLSLRLGNSLRYSGDQVGAAMVLKEAVQWAADKPAWHARFLHSLALLHRDSGQIGKALETMQYAVRQAFFSGQPELLNQTYLDLGKVLDVAGQSTQAAEELAEGVLMVTAGDGVDASVTPGEFWRLLAQLAELQLRQGNVPAALSAAESALAQARRQDSRIGQARCHFLLGRCLDRAGMPDAAEANHLEALKVFRSLGDRRSAIEVLLARSDNLPERRPDLMAQAKSLSEQIGWRPTPDALTR